MTTEPRDLPNDDTGDALRRLLNDGDDLNKARDVDFTVVFPTEETACQFAEHFRQLGHGVSVTNSNCVPELPWDVIVVHHIAPSHERITAIEESLQLVANGVGGRNDGWGCFANKVEAST